MQITVWGLTQSLHLAHPILRQRLNLSAARPAPICRRELETSVCLSGSTTTLPSRRGKNRSLQAVRQPKQFCRHVTARTLSRWSATSLPWAPIQVVEARLTGAAVWKTRRRRVEATAWLSMTVITTSTLSGCPIRTSTLSKLTHLNRTQSCTDLSHDDQSHAHE